MQRRERVSSREVIENRGAQRSDLRRSLSGAWGAEPPISIALASGVALALASCAMHPPVIADVSCPRGAALITAGEDGHCQLPDGTKHGPSFSVNAKGVAIDGYDHGALAGPWRRYDDRGRLVKHGYRPGVTDSSEPSTDLGESPYDSPATTGKLVVPSRVRLFPLQADVSFSATTLVSPEGHATSSFLGATASVDLPSPSRLRYRLNAYRAYYVSYGVEATTGIVARAECDEPSITGSGGFCGSRWMLGPTIRVGYARSTDANPRASVSSLLTYGKIAFLLGEDRWSSYYSTGSALIWRVRAGAGYTALGALFGVAARAHAPREGWRWLLVPLLTLVEHAEAYVELGGDGGSSLGAGAGVDVGFGL